MSETIDKVLDAAFMASAGLAGAYFAFAGGAHQNALETAPNPVIRQEEEHQRNVYLVAASGFEGAVVVKGVFLACRGRRPSRTDSTATSIPN